MNWIEAYVDHLFDDVEPLDIHEFAAEHGIPESEVEKLDSAVLYEPVMRRIRRECVKDLPKLIAALREKGAKGDAAAIRLVWTICKPETTRERFDDPMETFR